MSFSHFISKGAKFQRCPYVTQGRGQFSSRLRSSGARRSRARTLRAGQFVLEAPGGWLERGSALGALAPSCPVRAGHQADPCTDPHSTPHGPEGVTVHVGETQPPQPAGPGRGSLWVLQACVLEHQTQLLLTTSSPSQPFSARGCKPLGGATTSWVSCPLALGRQEEAGMVCGPPRPRPIHSSHKV